MSRPKKKVEVELTDALIALSNFAAARMGVPFESFVTGAICVQVGEWMSLDEIREIESTILTKDECQTRDRIRGERLADMAKIIDSMNSSLSDLPGGEDVQKA